MQRLLLAVFLALPVIAQTQKAPLPGIDKTSMEAYLRHQFMLPANFKVLISDARASDVPGLKQVDVTVSDGAQTNQKVPFYVSADGKKLIQGKVFDLGARPFAEEMKSLKVDGSAVAGPADAAVSIYVFGDFQCGFCREEAKLLREHLGSYPQVKMVFKDFPLEQIHPWARAASVAGRCIQNMTSADNFWRYHDWIFEQQSMITAENLRAKVLEFAGPVGVDTLMLGQCMDTKATDKEVQQSVEQARALQVDRTPTMFINGRRLTGNMPWEQLKAVIDYEVEYAKKNPAPASKKDEACCEVKLPIPGFK